jgi:hypothetical protein
MHGMSGIGAEQRSAGRLSEASGPCPFKKQTENHGCGGLYTCHIMASKSSVGTLMRI